MAIASLYPTIKPSLLLDFANSKKLDPRVTFTRSTTATYYDGVTTAKAEENLISYSQQFNLWAGVGTTVSADATTAPDGTATADKIVETAATSLHYRLIQPSQTRVASYTLSVYAKAAERDWLILWYSGTGGFEPYAYFDLTNGVVGSASVSATASIQAAANGFYRCQITITGQVIVPSFIVSVSDADNNNPYQTYLGDVTKGLFVWGAQLEQRSAATAYTPTTTQAITNYIPQLLTAPAGVPRFDHNPTTGESLGLLVEEQRTNLLTYSEDFSNAAWTPTGVTVSTNTVVAPDGTITADTITGDGAVSTHWLTQSNAALASGKTWSICAKAGTNNFIQLLFAGDADPWANFDLSSGTVGSTGTNVTATISALGNGWYRCTISTPSSSASSVFVALVDSASAPRNQSVALSTSVHLWGAQVEAGAFPTSYIPTTSASVTRTADSPSMTGVNFSSWYRQDEGTMFAEMQRLVANATIAYAVGTGNLNGTNSMYVLLLGNGNTQFSSSGGISIVGAQSGADPKKTCAAYKANDNAWVINGSVIGTDTSSSIAVVADTILLAGAFPIASNCGYYRKLAYYPERLTDAQLQALTA